MAVAWLVGLPQDPQQADFQRGTPENRISFQPDVGIAFFRPRSTKPNIPVTVSVRLTTAQVASLDNFVLNTLAFGSLPFTWKDFMTGAPADYVFAQGGLPTYSVVNGIAWQANFQLLKVGP